MELIIIFVFSLVPLLWFRGDQLILGHDSGFRLNFVEHLRNLTFAWHENANFGIDWSLYHGFFLIQLPETIFSALTGSLVWGERLAFVWWFALIGISMLFFARYFFPGARQLPLRIIAVTYWMFNFYILQAWAIAERAKFSLYIGLPIMIVIFFKTVKREWSITAGAILFGVLFFFMNGGGSPPLYGGIFITFGLLSVYFLLSDFRGNSRRVCVMIIVFGLCFAAFNAYWIVPQAGLFLGNYAGAVEGRGGIEGLIAWEREITKNASLLNILRFQGFPNWTDVSDHPYARAYLTNPFLIAISFLPIIVSVVGFIVLRKKITKKEREILAFLAVLGGVGLFFTAGSHPPLGSIYVFLMRYAPGFAIFRSSFYKFAPTVYLPIIVYFAYFLCKFEWEKLVNKNAAAQKTTKFVLAMLIAGGIVLYHFPSLTGNIFALRDGFTTRVSVPPYVDDTVSYLRTHTTPASRILLVPPLDAGFINSPIDTYDWGFYSLDALPRIIINRSFVANDAAGTDLTGLIYEAILKGDTDSVSRLSQITGITHILFRGDVRVSVSDSESQVAVWRDRLSVSGLFTNVFESGRWIIYSIGAAKALPSVYAASDIYTVSATGAGAGYVLGKVLSGEFPVLVTTEEDSSETVVPSKEDFIAAECFFCKESEYSRFLEAIRLPVFSERRFRGTAAAIQRSRGTPQEVDARLSAASLVLARGDEEAYLAQIQEIIHIVRDLEGRQKNQYTNRIAAFLEAHMRDTDIEKNAGVSRLYASIASDVWKAEGDLYRFGFVVPQEGFYQIWTPDARAYGETAEIDGSSQYVRNSFPLTRGYHRLAMRVGKPGSLDAIAAPVFIRRINAVGPITVPRVTFVRRNPTEYDVRVEGNSGPFWLVLNQQFDPRWEIWTSGKRQSYPHRKANGFANTWFVKKEGNYALTLAFAPQREFTLGVVISGVSIILACAYLVVKRI